jgi:type IV pilus assembly protein PilB
MEIGDAVREPIMLGATSVELRRRAVEGGMIGLRRSGLTKIKEGITSIEEVLRETVK